MWEKQKSRWWLYILLVLLIALISAFLVQSYLQIRQRDQLEDAALYQMANENPVTIQEVKQQKIYEVDAEFQRQMDVVQEYLPGIVCWGDVLTGGSASGVSFPDVLSQQIEKNISKVYDFKETLEDISGVSRVEWDDYTFKIPVVNMGTGKESTTTILGRAGVLPYVTTRDFTVPSSTEPVKICIGSADGSAVNPLLEGDPSVNPVYIDGIEGTLTPTTDSYRSSRAEYLFTRLTPGKEQEVLSGTEIHTSADELYQDYIHVVFMGTYGGFQKGIDLIEQQKKLIARQTKNSDRFIVIGPYCTQSEMYQTNFEQIEALMSQEFGDRFINLRKYLIADALTDAGIAKSKEDTYQINQNRVPTSLKTNATSLELNSTGYRLLGDLVYERMDKLGYFDEIREALKIPEDIESITEKK